MSPGTAVRLAAACLAVALVGCGDEPAEAEPEPADRFAGTWQAGAASSGYVTCGEQSPQTVSLSDKVLTIEKQDADTLTLEDSALAGCEITVTVSEEGVAVGTPGARCTIEDDSGGGVPRQIEVTVNELRLLPLSGGNLRVEWQDTSRAPQQPECVTEADFIVSPVDADAP